MGQNEEMSPIHICNQWDFVWASGIGLKELTNLQKAGTEIKKSNTARTLPVVNSVDRDQSF